VTPANGQTFVPIIQSSLVIGVDMRSPGESSSGSGPSWSDRLFLTLVHELGHTAGLQHTWTSSIMSTEITRAMTKAHPLGPDDVAGISMLYPTSDWRHLRTDPYAGGPTRWDKASRIPATSSGPSGCALVMARVISVDMMLDVQVCCSPAVCPNS